MKLGFSPPHPPEALEARQKEIGGVQRSKYRTRRSKAEQRRVGQGLHSPTPFDPLTPIPSGSIQCCFPPPATSLGLLDTHLLPTSSVTILSSQSPLSLSFDLARTWRETGSRPEFEPYIILPLALVVLPESSVLLPGPCSPSQVVCRRPQTFLPQTHRRRRGGYAYMLRTAYATSSASLKPAGRRSQFTSPLQRA